MKTLINISIMLVLSLGLWIYVDVSAQENSPNITLRQPENSTEMTDGVIRKIDRENRKITVKHGEIKNLEMPPMTMVFQVNDPAMLDKVKPGDNVKFRAEKSGGSFVVTYILVNK